MTSAPAGRRYGESFGVLVLSPTQRRRDRNREVGMRRILLVVTAVLLVLVLSFAMAGCRKSSGKKRGGGYLPAPTGSSMPAAVA
jgi:hypothetical protein